MRSGPHVRRPIPPPPPSLPEVRTPHHAVIYDGKLSDEDGVSAQGQATFDAKMSRLGERAIEQIRPELEHPQWDDGGSDR